MASLRLLFRQSRPGIAALLGKTFNLLWSYTALCMWKPEFDSRIRHHVKESCFACSRYFSQGQAIVTPAFTHGWGPNSGLRAPACVSLVMMGAVTPALWPVKYVRTLKHLGLYYSIDAGPPCALCAVGLHKTRSRSFQAQATTDHCILLSVLMSHRPTLS